MLTLSFLIALEHLGPVELRHPDVEHGHVRVQARDLVERVAAVRRLADQLEVLAVVDRADDPLPVDRVIVGDQDGNGHADESR